MESKMAEETDNRLIGIGPYMSEEQLQDETHGRVRVMLKNDFSDFLRAPTNIRLRVVVEQLLSYQDSHLLGTRRNIEKKTKTVKPETANSKP
jgi:hypothetical protein